MQTVRVARATDRIEREPKVVAVGSPTGARQLRTRMPRRAPPDGNEMSARANFEDHRGGAAASADHGQCARRRPGYRVTPEDQIGRGRQGRQNDEQREREGDLQAEETAARLHSARDVGPVAAGELGRDEHLEPLTEFEGAHAVTCCSSSRSAACAAWSVAETVPTSIPSTSAISR